MKNSYTLVKRKLNKKNIPIGVSIVFATFALIIGATFTLMSMNKVPNDLGITDHDLEPNHGSSVDKLFYSLFTLIAFAAYIPVFLSKKGQLENLLINPPENSSATEQNYLSIQSISAAQLEGQDITPIQQKKHGKKPRIAIATLAATYRGLGGIVGPLSFMPFNKYAALLVSSLLVGADGVSQVAQIFYQRENDKAPRSKLKLLLLGFNSIWYATTNAFQYGYYFYLNLEAIALHYHWFKNDFSTNWELFTNKDKHLDGHEGEFILQVFLLAPIIAYGIFYAYRLTISTMHQWDTLLERLASKDIDEKKSATWQALIGILSGQIKAIAGGEVIYKVSKGLGIDHQTALTTGILSTWFAGVSQAPVIAYRNTSKPKETPQEDNTISETQPFFPKH